MKYSYWNEIDIDSYAYIGFDMDGTLYDEREFIEQAYLIIIDELKLPYKNEVYSWMLNRWIEKGSSYPYIFIETIKKFNLVAVQSEDFLRVYRDIKPILKLNPKVSSYLRIIGKKKLFLVTDGNSKLQKSKFEALGLNNYFYKEKCKFTGDLGSEFYKPNVRILAELKKNKDFEGKVVYFGDREIDERFANNAGYDFVKVEDFSGFWGSYNV